MKITESEFRRLHFKSRTLDRVCRILWPEDSRPKPAIECVLAIEEAIGAYRPEPEQGVSIVKMLRPMQDVIDKLR